MTQVPFEEWTDPLRSTLHEVFLGSPASRKANLYVEWPGGAIAAPIGNSSDAIRTAMAPRTRLAETDLRINRSGFFGRGADQLDVASDDRILWRARVLANSGSVGASPELTFRGSGPNDKREDRGHLRPETQPQDHIKCGTMRRIFRGPRIP
jgi:hypothetical protein